MNDWFANNSIGLWVAFNALILALVLVDLMVFSRRSHAPNVREALVWSGVWITIALAFNALVYAVRGSQAGLEFLAGYLIEKSLSVDNLFVFVLIFSYFGVPAAYRHTVLFWGILGALVMRLGFILAGVALLERFHWLIYLFGAVLVLSGIKMWTAKDRKLDPSRNPVVRLFRHLVPVTDGFEGGRLLLRRAGRWMATPLLVVLVVVETTDLIFAIDSIPAVLAVTRDPFIVYSSNAFAMIGLRALFFALAGLMGLFHRLHYGLSAILVFVGGKMVLAETWEIPIAVSLAVVGAILAVSIAASLARPLQPVAHRRRGPDEA